MRFVYKLLALTAMIVMGSRPAYAEIIVDALEVGGNVVFAGDGTADLTGLTSLGPGGGGTGVHPIFGILVFGAPFNNYGGTSGPLNFGTGIISLANSSSGDVFGIVGNTPGYGLLVPAAYVSGAPLSATMTFNGKTFASLGVTPGTYVWTWGNGAHADSFTLNIGATAIPEPSSFAFCGAAVLGLILFRSVRRCTQSA